MDLISSHNFSIVSPQKSTTKQEFSTLFSNQGCLRASTANETVRRSVKTSNLNSTTIEPSNCHTTNINKNNNNLTTKYSNTLRYRSRDGSSNMNRNRKTFVSMSVNSAPH